MMDGKPTGVVYVVKSKYPWEKQIQHTNWSWKALLIVKIEVNPFSSSVQLTRTETVTFQAHWMHAIQQNLIYTLSPCYVQIHWSSNDIKLMLFLGEQWGITILIWRVPIINHKFLLAIRSWLKPLGLRSCYRLIETNNCSLIWV